MTNLQLNSENKTVRLLAVPVKLAAATCIAISVGGVLWRFLAKVPIYANGVAILLPTNKSKIFRSQSSGTVIHFTDQAIYQNDKTRLLSDFGSSKEDLSAVEILELANYALGLGDQEMTSPLIVASTETLPNNSLLSMLDSDGAKASLQTAICVSRNDVVQKSSLGSAISLF